MLALVLLVISPDDRTSKGDSSTVCPFSDSIRHVITVKKDMIKICIVFSPNS